MTKTHYNLANVNKQTLFKQKKAGRSKNAVTPSLKLIIKPQYELEYFVRNSLVKCAIQLA